MWLRILNVEHGKQIIYLYLAVFSVQDDQQPLSRTIVIIVSQDKQIIVCDTSSIFLPLLLPLLLLWRTIILIYGILLFCIQNLLPDRLVHFRVIIMSVYQNNIKNQIIFKSNILFRALFFIFESLLSVECDIFFRHENILNLV